jgi:hypothetical protein
MLRSGRQSNVISTQFPMADTFFDSLAAISEREHLVPVVGKIPPVHGGIADGIMTPILPPRARLWRNGPFNVAESRSAPAT